MPGVAGSIVGDNQVTPSCSYAARRRKLTAFLDLQEAALFFQVMNWSLVLPGHLLAFFFDWEVAIAACPSTQKLAGVC